MTERNNEVPQPSQPMDLYGEEMTPEQEREAEEEAAAEVALFLAQE